MIEIVIPILCLLILLIIGVPVAYALAASGTVGLLMVLGVSQMDNLLSQLVYNGINSYSYATIPMFIMMAYFLTESGLTEKIFTVGHRFLSNLRGGLAFATTVANGGMAALSGSTTASAATMASIAVPEMKKHGYGDEISLGTVAAAGTFATMFPPSLGLIVYGLFTNTSISDLFLAGIVPGLLTVVGYGMVIYIWGIYEPDMIGSQSETFSTQEKLDSLKPVWPALLILALVIGGLYGGVVTPTEAGSLGAAATLLVAIGIGQLKYDGITSAIQRTAETTTMIFMIIIGAQIFGRYLAYTGVTTTLIDTVSGLPIPGWGIILVIILLYVFLGMFMDQLAILILTLPLTFPVVTNLGYSPIWFGIIIAKTIEVGLVTPPLGLNVYVATSTVDIDVETGFRGAVRFIPVDIGLLIIFLAEPRVILAPMQYL
jgi:C4-dicarboxylate transporter DctM subunit